MAEYKCGKCGSWYRGVPFDQLSRVTREHIKNCEKRVTECDSKTQMNEVVREYTDGGAGVMITLTGSDSKFRCKCGANVFRKAKDPQYGEIFICNACRAEYLGE
ncbi:hypothetical protein SEA_SIXAMA_34 [Gordonia phage Sixama]|uniref:Uncharacterized protein n=1 Tax=Gordonia phage Sixama TaxID=2653271 RepID=A0A5Q2F672_9CAUD|nr:hypothetical protein PP302_gp034 [Gordonia phage Sixama]QGF20213.1 hypothetical protein SEA_SIXAMA_34 [Gordonia phage Sixama]